MAALHDPYADNAIGNVNGSNAVNVFLGLGIAWLVAAVVHLFRGQPFKVKSDTLAFSVTLYIILAVFCIAWLLLRRLKFLAGGELGGPPVLKWASLTFFVILWVIYLAVSSLESYCIISFG